ncbi:MAG: D-glycero-beta-D-manno-heptose-7-phosphate kinase [Roseiarcus sp.]|jgi:D-beta-D-heptose 7-phosphate kinase/D-beta-D-heptose 1-phosphate adenosyltransferase
MAGILEGFDSARVAVVGDLMLDVYIQGDVERISPEAPVPVIRSTSERAVAGGAANVAANVAALGGAVRLVGLAGGDSAYERLRGLLGEIDGIDLSGMVPDGTRATTTKTRVVGHRQQIVRIDREASDAPAAAVQAALVANTNAAIDASQIAVFSDYGKGVFSDRVLAATLDHARRVGARAIVDPKRRDLSVYRGATIITPNQAELALATGRPCQSDAEAEAAARVAQDLCGADVLLTRSEKGMSYFPLRGAAIHLPTVAREVFDVSGAGDTVVAAIAIALAAGHPLVEAMRIANHAAGVVVGKFGAATVTRAELLAAMGEASRKGDVTDGRVLDRAELVAQRAFWRREGLTVGIANGCFDLIHPGHISLIRQAAAACDRLVVALNTDASVRRLKGPARPVQNEAARADVMGALRGVAALTFFDEDTPRQLIAAVLPDVLVKGADYAEAQVVGAEIVKAAGGSVLLAELTPGRSTSRLLSAIQSND